MICKMNRRIRFWIFMLLFLSSICTAGKTRSWPCWRGASQDGISRESGWEPKILNKGVNILWRTTIGQGHSNLSIDNGLIITQGSEISESAGRTIFRETIVCLSAESGRKYFPLLTCPNPGQEPPDLIHENFC